MKKYAVLQNKELGNRFFTMNSENVTKLHDGTEGYYLIAEVDTVEEAQIALYGVSFPTPRGC